MAAIIETQHLTHIYGAGMPDATVALEDVSFSVEAGDFVGIIGSTGSGKSTLISHFNGLLKPTSGKVLVDGQDIWADPSQIRKFRFLVGMVMQYPEYQLFEETVYKDIAFGPKNMGLSKDEIDARVRRAAGFLHRGSGALVESFLICCEDIVIIAVDIYLLKKLRILCSFIYSVFKLVPVLCGRL